MSWFRDEIYLFNSRKAVLTTSLDTICLRSFPSSTSNIQCFRLEVISCLDNLGRLTSYMFVIFPSILWRTSDMFILVNHHDLIYQTSKQNIHLPLEDSSHILDSKWHSRINIGVPRSHECYFVLLKLFEHHLVMPWEAIDHWH